MSFSDLRLPFCRFDRFASVYLLDRQLDVACSTNAHGHYGCAWCHNEPQSRRVESELLNSAFESPVSSRGKDIKALTCMHTLDTLLQRRRQMS